MLQSSRLLNQMAATLTMEKIKTVPELLGDTEFSVLPSLDTSSLQEAAVNLDVVSNLGFDIDRKVTLAGANEASAVSLAALVIDGESLNRLGQPQQAMLACKQFFCAHLVDLICRHRPDMVHQLERRHDEAAVGSSAELSIKLLSDLTAWICADT